MTAALALRAALSDFIENGFETALRDAASEFVDIIIAVQFLKALKPKLESLINKKLAEAPMLVGSSHLKPPTVPIAMSTKETTQPAFNASSGPRRYTSKMLQPNNLIPATRLNRQELERLGR